MAQELPFKHEKEVIFEEVIEEISAQKENVKLKQAVFDNKSQENMEKFVLEIAENVLREIQPSKHKKNDEIKQEVQIDEVQAKKVDQNENQNGAVVQLIEQVKEEPLKQTISHEDSQIQKEEHQLSFQQIVKMQDNQQKSIPVANDVPQLQQYPPKIVETKTFNRIIQQRKQRLEERYKKSQRTRATIIKLEPIATKKQSDFRTAINTLKMAQTAQFLVKKGNQQNSKPKFAATQWRQQRDSKQKRIKDLIANTPSPQKQTQQISKFTGINPTKSRNQKSPFPYKNSPSLPKLQRRGVSQRVMPYNIYNLYQRGSQLYKLSSLLAP